MQPKLTISQVQENTEDVCVRLETHWQLGNHMLPMVLPSPKSLQEITQDLPISQSAVHKSSGFATIDCALTVYLLDLICACYCMDFETQRRRKGHLTFVMTQHNKYSAGPFGISHKTILYIM